MARVCLCALCRGYLPQPVFHEAPYPWGLHQQVYCQAHFRKYPEQRVCPLVLCRMVLSVHEAVAGVCEIPVQPNVAWCDDYTSDIYASNGYGPNPSSDYENHGSEFDNTREAY